MKLYRGFKIKENLWNKIVEVIKDDYRYNNPSEFIRQAIIEKIEKLELR